MSAKRLSAFCPSTIQGLPACLGRHSCAETLAALPDQIRASLQMFFHSVCQLLTLPACVFISFDIITQMKPKSTLKVNNEIEILTHAGILSSAACKYICTAGAGLRTEAGIFVDWH